MHWHHVIAITYCILSFDLNKKVLLNSTPSIAHYATINSKNAHLPTVAKGKAFKCPTLGQGSTEKCPPSEFIIIDKKGANCKVQRTGPRTFCFKTDRIPTTPGYKGVQSPEQVPPSVGRGARGVVGLMQTPNHQAPRSLRLGTCSS